MLGCVDVVTAGCSYRGIQNFAPEPGKKKGPARAPYCDYLTQQYTGLKINIFHDHLSLGIIYLTFYLMYTQNL